MFPYLAQNVLLPLLVAVGAGIVLLWLGGGVKWRLTKHLYITLPIVLAAYSVCYFATRRSEPAKPPVVAGRIVNDLNESVPQATVSLADGSRRSESDDDGKFSLDLTGKAHALDTVRIRVSKAGYSQFEGTTQVPADDFIIHLHPS
jgi:hypothetical protein